MTAAAERNGSADRPANDERAGEHAPPEETHAPLMAAVGAVGVAAAAVAVVLGLSGTPALPFPTDVPPLPTEAVLPAAPPTGRPDAPRPAPLPTGVPNLPTSFPGPSDFPHIGGAP
ncbi:hypothetical protein [Streptomyces sp. NPDC049906]|uniref:hypothetical protein n=1 Tax=Streptomyces sp. NPDC049906 TaxID=3155656 RepID=UPI00343AC061